MFATLTPAANPAEGTAEMKVTSIRITVQVMKIIKRAGAISGPSAGDVLPAELDGGAG